MTTGDMTRDIVITLIAFAFLITASPDLSAAGEAGVTGNWATTGYGATVRLESCPEASDELCGTLTWLWDALDADGNPLKDVENPVRELRQRPLIGTRILAGFRRDEDGAWRGGRVYNPEDGRTYSGTIQLDPNGNLQLKGCAFFVFCQTRTWRRPVEACTAGMMPDRQARTNRYRSFTSLTRQLVQDDSQRARIAQEIEK